MTWYVRIVNNSYCVLTRYHFQNRTCLFLSLSRFLHRTRTHLFIFKPWQRRENSVSAKKSCNKDDNKGLPRRWIEMLLQRRPTLVVSFIDFFTGFEGPGRQSKTERRFKHERHRTWNKTRMYSLFSHYLFEMNHLENSYPQQLVLAWAERCSRLRST